MTPNLLTAAPRTRLLQGVVVLVSLVIVVLSAVRAFGSVGDLPADAVLRYDGRVVTADELDDRVEVLAALYGVKAPDDGSAREAFDREAAKSFAVSEILAREADRRGIVVAKKQATDQLDTLIDEQLQGGRDAFVQFLQEKGISEGDVLEEISRQIATARVIEQVTKDVPETSDGDVDAYYARNKDAIVQPEQRTLSNIVVGDEETAKDVVAKVRAGEDFATLAKELSRDASTKDKGGELGVVTQGQLDSAFGEAAFAAREKDVFGPVQSQFGWNVGRVDSVTPAKALKLEDIRDDLKIELQNRARLAAWRSELGRLLRKADVDYADRYRPDDPDAPPTELTEGRGQQ